MRLFIAIFHCFFFLLSSLKAQKPKNQIYFSLDTFFNFKNRNTVDIVYFNEFILKNVIVDSSAKKKYEFLRINNKDYYLKVTTLYGEILEEGQVTISKKPFFSDSYFVWFNLQKNGYWKEKNLSNLIEKGRYDYGSRIGKWQVIEGNNKYPILEETYFSNRLTSSKQLNYLKTDFSKALLQLIGKWQLVTDESINSDSLWVFTKLKALEVKFVKNSIEVKNDSTGIIKSWSVCGSKPTNFKLKTDLIKKNIQLKFTETNMLMDIVFINAEVLLVNVNPIEE